jgi:hypothetical protein
MADVLDDWIECLSPTPAELDAYREAFRAALRDRRTRELLIQLDEAMAHADSGTVRELVQRLGDAHGAAGERDCSPDLTVMPGEQDRLPAVPCAPETPQQAPVPNGTSDAAPPPARPAAPPPFDPFAYEGIDPGAVWTSGFTFKG